MNAKALQKVKFRQWVCELVFGRYENDCLSIQLMSIEGEPIARATVNEFRFPLAGDEVLIKSDAENEGMLEALIKAGIVEPTGVICKVGLGHAEAHVCRLLIDPPAVH